MTLSCSLRKRLLRKRRRTKRLLLRSLPRRKKKHSRKKLPLLKNLWPGKKNEKYFLEEKAQIILTPDEHDLMMEKSSLDIIVPEILLAIR